MGTVGPVSIVQAFLQSAIRWGSVLFTRVLPVMSTTSHSGRRKSQAESGQSPGWGFRSRI